jgi:SAM-dependent methyltransferase
MIHLYNTASQALARQIVIEAEASTHDPMTPLRKLALSDYGELMLSLPDAELPFLSGYLSPLPPAEEQAIWTGASGRELLQDSLSFSRIVVSKFEGFTGQTISDARVLDYGCGFGRLLRIMSYYVDRNKLFGVDPWDRSIAICKDWNVPAEVAQSDFLPTDLPMEGQFDLAYSYSVFTHTSERATRSALAALRKRATSGALLAMTVREVEFWRRWAPSQGMSEEKIASLIDSHETKGFAFESINLEPVDGDITFGNTSMSLGWIEKNISGWSIIGYDRGIDYTQTIIFMRPR